MNDPKQVRALITEKHYLWLKVRVAVNTRTWDILGITRLQSIHL